MDADQVSVKVDIRQVNCIASGKYNVYQTNLYVDKFILYFFIKDI